jgi:hypothetical protein
MWNTAGLRRTDGKNPAPAGCPDTLPASAHARELERMKKSDVEFDHNASVLVGIGDFADRMPGHLEFEHEKDRRDGT